jgi:ubiquinone/menaquinone biosynthesis C-methylase UbiE
MLGKAKPRVHDAIRCDARYLPFRAGSFDVAFESSCLYLVKDKGAMVKEMCRVARSLVIIFESNRLSVRRLCDKHVKGSEMSPEHPTPSEVKRYMAEAGLSPKIQMVGFSPLFGGDVLLRIWKPIEWLVERLPGLSNFAGGILAYAHIDKR